MAAPVWKLLDQPSYFRYNCRGTQNIDFTFNNFSLENLAVYEIMWRNIVERGRPQMAVWRMPIACRITKATDTHSEYVILIAFGL